jgi:disulfide bond formation protein DsbB
MSIRAVRARLWGDGRPWIAFGLLVATVATAGSLFYSLGWQLFPCRLCWYQRILMYPLPVVLAYGLLTGKRDIYLAVLPLTLLGGTVAAYHTWLQFQPPGTCAFVGCSTVKFRFAGLLTIPNQSLLANLLLTVSMVGLALVGRNR